MTADFGFWDYFIFIAYAVLILGVGLWVSRDKKGHQKNAEDYFSGAIFIFLEVKD